MKVHLILLSQACLAQVPSFHGFHPPLLAWNPWITDVNTPFYRPDSDCDAAVIIQVTDPAQPLYGRQFELISTAHDPQGHVLVRYRDGIMLRLPRAATSLLNLGHDAPCDRLCRSAVQELLCLVKEYESCPKVKKSPQVPKCPRAKSGPRSRPRTSKKSSRN
jgi:hypothetical protein